MVAEGGTTRATVRVAAPAKLNLYLHIVGQRPDGYHLLDTLVAFAGIGDEVSVAPHATIELTLAGPFAKALEAEVDNLEAEVDNIVLRAARALREYTGTKAGAAITLTKRLPVAAGLGGGSADAAATLVALRQLWRLTVCDTAIETMALRLGADVPVCLSGGAALVSGIGEILAPAPTLPAAHVVLAGPGSRLATPDVYAAFDAQPTTSTAPAARVGVALPARGAVEFASFLAERDNDLEPVACRLAPGITDALEMLRSQRGTLLARMSGSGPTCFALFAEAAEAVEAAATVTAARPGWWVAAAPLLGGIARA